jgi:O-antigen/teichoic acid export membrane protein
MLRLLFGPQYAPALTMARILLVASLFQGVNQISGAALRSLNKPGRTSLAESVGVLVTVVLLVVLLPRLGALGAAIASLVAYMVVCAVQMFSLVIDGRRSLALRVQHVSASDEASLPQPMK